MEASLQAKVAAGIVLCGSLRGIRGISIEHSTEQPDEEQRNDEVAQDLLSNTVILFLRWCSEERLRG